MSVVFLKLLNMSITASWLILAVIIVRLLMKKAPKWINCVLWALVAIRLVCPFSITSAFSLIPSSETIPKDIEMMQNPAIDSGVKFINETLNPVVANSLTPEPMSSANPLQIIIPVLSVVWIAGIASMLLYALISYTKLKRSVGVSVIIKGNILACDEVKSPFILGIMKPQIYVPSSMDSDTLEYVITHETAHIARRDHWWKPLGFLLLSVYWFNPLCWIAYILLCRDIEMACDEKVIGKLDNNDKAAYSQALLNCSFPRRRVAACPLAFGEVGVKERVKSVLNYKKPAFWIIVIAVILCVVLAVCFLTDPYSAESSDGKPGISSDETEASEAYMLSEEAIGVAIDQATMEQYAKDVPDGNICVTSHKILDIAVDERNNTITVYAWVLYERYVPYSASGSFGTSVPVALTFTIDPDKHEIEELNEYWIPRDGSYYSDDIKKKFSKAAQNYLKNKSEFIEELKTENLNKANDAIKKLTFSQESFDALIDEICSSPKESSSYGDYINAHPNEYESLLQYGELGMQYIFKEFLEGGQTGLRGQILWHLLCGFAPERDFEIRAENGQKSFELWQEEAQRLYTENGAEWMEKYQPSMLLLIKMLENTSVNLSVLSDKPYAAGGWVWPCDNNRIAVPFGKRVHPITNEVEDCNHINIVGEKGDPVYAACSGEVVKAEYSSGYGNYIEIKHTDGVSSQYWHLSELNVTVGTQVLAGDTIGTIGATGMATGPNLGFVVTSDGEYVDPLMFYLAYDGAIVQ